VQDFFDLFFSKADGLRVVPLFLMDDSKFL